ncbi:MAG: hypothetical protein ACYCT1_04085 [Steroidobacteraceae bacterium]
MTTNAKVCAPEIWDATPENALAAEGGAAASGSLGGRAGEALWAGVAADVPFRCLWNIAFRPFH